MCLTIISVFWMCCDHIIKGTVKFITNFRLSLAQVNWNVVDRFLDVQPWGALQQQTDSLQWLAAADNKLIQWRNA